MTCFNSIVYAIDVWRETASKHKHIQFMVRFVCMCVFAVDIYFDVYLCDILSSCIYYTWALVDTCCVV